MRRRVARAFWRVFNPIAMRLAGIAPWWVVLETRGRQTGRVRRVPLARGPVDGATTWLIAVHGRGAGFVRNIEASPGVRLRLRGRWRTGTAEVEPYDEAVAGRFNLYARMGPATLGIDPVLVRVDLRD
jgi:deazaflavin-dependent oxidoreductase (nitroreductase family)